jgi:hypothetical protein
MNSSPERRSNNRIVTQLPVRVRSAPAKVESTAETRDLSNNGIFLYTDSRLAAGADLELVLMLPPELTSGKKCWVCCHAQVVRVEEGNGLRFGVAAEIKRMDVLPEIPA